MNEQTIRIGDFDCWVRRQGDAGPPVLFVMGFGMSGLAWAPQADGLSVDHRVALYDNRGIGRSTAGKGPHDVHRLAADAAALIDTLGWGNAHVVGVSMGGMVVQQMMLRHASKLRSATLIATHPGPKWRMLPGLEAVRLFAEVNTSAGEARLAALKRLLYPADAEPETRLGPDDLASIAAPADPEIRMSHLKSMLKLRSRRKLARLHAPPTLIIKPAKDILVPPRGSDALARCLPDARMVTIEDGGHGVTMQHASRVNALLREHIAAVEAD